MAVLLHKSMLTRHIRKSVLPYCQLMAVSPSWLPALLHKSMLTRLVRKTLHSLLSTTNARLRRMSDYVNVIHPSLANVFVILKFSLLWTAHSTVTGVSCLPHNQLVEQPWPEEKEREQLHVRLFANAKFLTKMTRMILGSKRRTQIEVSAFITRKSIAVGVKSFSSAVVDAYEFHGKDTTHI